MRATSVTSATNGSAFAQRLHDPGHSLSYQRVSFMRGGLVGQCDRFHARI